jgi:biopolymer transport protein ExbD
MAARNFRRYRDNTPMADMNVVPLVDVMLVLLVIFIVTAPLLTHAVKIDLPKASSSVEHHQARTHRVRHPRKR